jgi:hypothetical protein
MILYSILRLSTKLAAYGTVILVFCIFKLNSAYDAGDRLYLKVEECLRQEGVIVGEIEPVSYQSSAVACGSTDEFRTQIGLAKEHYLIGQEYASVASMIVTPLGMIIGLNVLILLALLWRQHSRNRTSSPAM